MKCVKRNPIKTKTDSQEESLSEIFNYDTYFQSAEANEEGIETKYSVAFKNEVVKLIQELGVGVVLDLDEELLSETGKRLIRRALDMAHPKFSEMFETRENPRMRGGIEGLKRYLEENEGQFTVQEIIYALEDGEFLSSFFEDGQDKKNQEDIEELYDLYNQKLLKEGFETRENPRMRGGIEGLKRYLEENEGQFSVQEIIYALEDGEFLSSFFEDVQDKKNQEDIEELYDLYNQKLLKEGQDKNFKKRKRSNPDIITKTETIFEITPERRKRIIQEISEVEKLLEEELKYSKKSKNMKLLGEYEKHLLKLREALKEGYLEMESNPRPRKFKDTYVIVGMSSYGREDIDEFETLEEANKMIKEYRMAMPTFSLKIVKRKEPLEIKQNPLRRGKSREIVSSNIRELMHKGYPQKQSVAISLKKAGMSRKNNPITGGYDVGVIKIQKIGKEKLYVVRDLITDNIFVFDDNDTKGFSLGDRVKYFTNENDEPVNVKLMTEADEEEFDDMLFHEAIKLLAAFNKKHRDNYFAAKEISKKVVGELEEFYVDGIKGHMVYGNREALFFIDGKEEPFVVNVDYYGDRPVMVWG